MEQAFSLIHSLARGLVKMDPLRGISHVSMKPINSGLAAPSPHSLIDDREVPSPLGARINEPICAAKEHPKQRQNGCSLFCSSPSDGISPQVRLEKREGQCCSDPSASPYTATARVMLLLPPPCCHDRSHLAANTRYSSLSFSPIHIPSRQNTR